MSKSIEEVIREKTESIAQGTNMHGVGRVKRVKQYMIEVSGLEDAGYFERVSVGANAEGYIESIDRSSVVVALTRQSGSISVGDIVTATGKTYMARFSHDSVGHVVDMFAVDKLAGMEFDDSFEIPVQTPPIPIMDRTSVNRPLHTGIIGIDMLYPIGRGQRQLIIGDKKTGKSQIVLDTIVNQRGKEVLCIYVAIGKTKKEVKEVYANLLKQGAMEYTIILAAFNDECPPVLKNTPYTAVSIAEHYMMQGADVLVAIDDLKRHADVCREIALLSGKVPGRDAYPPDIFYAHSSLLEKGCQYKNGGSITILPIVETKGGDITDYISTNIISITDGQIVLSTKNFMRGEKPAINYGLSVSRLGGAVQTKNIKKLGARVRRELLAYLENREVFELANIDEMGDALRDRMRRGATILQRLKQYKFSPVTVEEMITMFKDVREEEE